MYNLYHISLIYGTTCRTGPLQRMNEATSREPRTGRRSMNILQDFAIEMSMRKRRKSVRTSERASEQASKEASE